MIDKEDFKIIEGNCLETLKTLPDESVQCCITSPPYYGLRDYGTAKWVGGDENCPHYRTSKQSDKTATGHKAMMEQGEAVGDAIYKTICPLCGAVRVDEQIGLEETPEEYVNKLVEVFRQVKRVLKKDGTLWLNLGDSYNGSGGNHKGFHKNDSGFQGKVGALYGGRGNHISTIKPKDLIGIPWMVAFALRADGWWLRQDIIFSKLNPMPESVTDRCTKSHEYIFLLSKSPNYLFNHERIQEVATGYDGRKDTMLKGSPKYVGQNIMPNSNEQLMASSSHERWRFKNLEYDGQKSPNTMHKLRAEGFADKVYTKEEDGVMAPIRNKRDVWNISLVPYKGAHFATYPIKLIEPCVLAGSNEGDTILDPFNGAATTGICALMHGRKYIGCELNPKYIELSMQRFDETFNGVKHIEEIEEGDDMTFFDWGITDD